MTVAPPRWDTAQLAGDAAIATQLFREERMGEPLEEYLERFEEVRSKMEDLLEMTVDLSKITQMAVDVLTDRGLSEAVRYLAGPPISEADLSVLAETSLSAKALKKDPEAATRAVEVVLLGLDRNRFPWVGEDREPTEAERLAATIASSAIVAARRVMTKRANESKGVQEKAVAAALESVPMRPVEPRTINVMDEAPDRGEFVPAECLIATRKADLNARLFDGRLMPIECKVSNSSTNSIKRLNNDAAVKAETWLDKLGSTQVVPVAVLSGVFKVRNLEQAQERGLTLFWAHDLDKLVEWVRSTK